jgi:hypothetical protein
MHFSLNTISSIASLLLAFSSLFYHSVLPHARNLNNPPCRENEPLRDNPSMEGASLFPDTTEALYSRSQSESESELESELTAKLGSSRDSQVTNRTLVRRQQK